MFVSTQHLRYGKRGESLDVCCEVSRGSAWFLKLSFPEQMTLWPSGLRRWLKAPFRKGVGSNPTAVILLSGQSSKAWAYRTGPDCSQHPQAVFVFTSRSESPPQDSVVTTYS